LPTSSLPSALSLYRLSLDINPNTRYGPGFAGILEGYTDIAVNQKQGMRAARLFGIDAAIRESLGTPVYPCWSAEYEENIRQTCELIGSEAFLVAWGEGRGITQQQAIAYMRSTD
jgi:hypothetical protein